MESTRSYFVSTILRSVAAVALIAGAVGIIITTTKAQANRSWTAAGSSGTIDDDSLAIAQFKNFAVTLQPGVNGTARVRYNITAVDGMNQLPGDKHYYQDSLPQLRQRREHRQSSVRAQQSMCSWRQQHTLYV